MKYKEFEIMYARMILGLSNYDMSKASDEDVEKVLKLNNWTEEEFKEEADWYLSDGCGIKG